MAYDHYPTADDLLAFLEGAGLSVSDALSDYLEGAAEAGRLEFERRTGRRPFLAGTATTRYLDPPTRSKELVLEPTLAALTSVTYTPTGATPTVLANGTDFSIYPLNAVADGVPISRLRFSTRRWLDPLPLAQRGSLAILGQWGYATEIPADAWLAMCALGASAMLPQLNQALRNGILEWKEKDRAEKYSDLATTLGGSWSQRVERAVSSHRRILI